MFRLKGKARAGVSRRKLVGYKGQVRRQSGRRLERLVDG